MLPREGGPLGLVLPDGENLIGGQLKKIGLQLTENTGGQTLAYLIGWVVVLGGVWLLGLLF